MDEVRKAIITELRSLLKQHPEIERLILIDDLFGSLHAVAWLEKNEDAKKLEALNEVLKEIASPFWAEALWNASEGNASDTLFFEYAWKEGQTSDENDRFRIVERHRNRGAWLGHLSTPPWSLDESNPPVIVFYSFKGGVGRTTALASFAIQQAHSGDRIVIIDFDLDAPGIGTLFAADHENPTQWGVVDFILENRFGENDLRDYYYACRREKISGSGEILVIPAGQVNEDYLGKLVRVDSEPPSDTREKHPLCDLLIQIKEELKPQWILIDARAGISEPAGLLLNGIAHLNVLFGTFSDQSWQGLRLVLDKLGAQRIQQNLPQSECILVQAMIPEDSTVGIKATHTFSERARDEFSNYYYAEDPEDPDEDTYWYNRDLENDTAPHVPLCLTYQPRLAQFEKIDDVADTLVESPQYVELAKRIIMRVKWSEP